MKRVLRREIGVTMDTRVRELDGRLQMSDSVLRAYAWSKTLLAAANW
jgi:hypothetical protein